MGTLQYTKELGTAYFLPSDDEENQRLNRQHGLLTRTLPGGLIQAPVGLQDKDFVLDNATGNGVWLLELASKGPKGAQYIGIDMQPRLLPPPSSTPSNVQFIVKSILELPAEWTNRFTFVHQRLLVCALRKKEWPQVLKEIYRVLKPGGWVQLTEVENWVAGPITRIVQTLVDKAGQHRGTEGWPGLGNPLVGHLKACGFQNIQLIPHNTPLGASEGEDGSDGKNNIATIFNGIRSHVLECGGFGLVNSEEKYDELLAQVREEVDASQGGRIEWFVVYAQKP
ncbi:hypothetical protein NP233_g1012 [Leucocoprinus birnbaumii]|uniref:Methyltransferase domain-containing protein n=1 Tax=Leucocoprinus birnbaumii TaxID=56174 RepID=A0AAD5W1U8_9AGAR|nr:hypothetical protein NP233_g1012 [Leucocoprinus birnbaumii]